MPEVIICEDDQNVREVMAAICNSLGFVAVEVEDGEACLRVVSEAISAVVLDLGLPRMPGLKVLARIRHTHPHIPIIVVTADHSVESAIQAMRQGASDYILKPMSREKLQHALREAVVTRPIGPVAIDAIIESRHPEVNRLFLAADQFARTSASVVITGASGTGKEILARWIHSMSGRQGAFVAVNCPGIPSSLAESELFGHEKGSFTGALGRKQGRLEIAHRGTVFFDEIADLDLQIQAKILRVLQQRTVSRVGSLREERIDIRVIVATNRSLRELAHGSGFRQDLFYRLADIELCLPTLAERACDIPMFIDYFAQEQARECQQKPRKFNEDAVRVLMNAPWPGNIRELRSAVRRMLILNPEKEITAQMVRTDSLLRKSPAIDSIASSAEYQKGMPEPVQISDRSLALSEKEAITEGLKRNLGNLSKTAQELKISRSTLYRKIKKYGLVS